MARFNFHQILQAEFSSNDDIRLIVMTGGSRRWHLESEYLSMSPELVPEGESASAISIEYNQIWEAKGRDDPEYGMEGHGKLVLLDGDGLTGAPGTAVRGRDELMTDPNTLKAFINYGVSHFPAEKYDLILWDHGAGPTGGQYAEGPGEDRSSKIRRSEEQEAESGCFGGDRLCR